MWNRVLSVATWIILLGCFSPGIAGTKGLKVEVWKTESFVKKAQAVKAGDWDDVSPQDVAIAGLYEVGRAVERIENRIESRVDRLYRYASVGALVLAAYLVLQLLMTLILVVRIGRKSI